MLSLEKSEYEKQHEQEILNKAREKLEKTLAKSHS